MAKLSRRAIKALLGGRHASRGGRTLSQRSQNLLTIASSYSKDELLAESGIGHRTAEEIRLWVQTQIRNEQPDA
jgi:hypothetical protein